MKPAALSPAALALRATKGAWKYLRHWRLYDAIALAILSGTVTNLLLNVQPQTGKSEYWSRFFPAWYIGRNPNKRVALGSYAAQFASTWGRKARDVMHEVGRDVFDLALNPDAAAADDWNLLGHPGGMVTAGMEGGLTGRAADLLIVDDPIKNHEEAMSKSRKDMVWDWWDSTVNTRLHQGGVRVVLMTRWAVDDLAGRILARAAETGEKWTHICLPAFAEKDEDFAEQLDINGNPLKLGWKRSAGDVLCPDLYNLETMQARQQNNAGYWWESLYMQRPYVRGGGQLRSEWFNVVEADPQAVAACRAWDLAASTDPGAKRTAGVLVTRPKDRKGCHIKDVVYGRWAPADRNRKIKQTAEMDGKSVTVLVEQEPGSGGIAQVQEIARDLQGYTVRAVKPTGDKTLRADPLASQAQVGAVTVRNGPWLKEFFLEIDWFPGGPTIDMVDAAAEGYNWLAEKDRVSIVSSDYARNPAQHSAGRMFGSATGRMMP